MTLAQEGHLFHNRLTHSLKVAQVGRRLAENLLASSGEEHIDLLARKGGLDPDTVEAACLAHDLGHPPFGHIGEAQLDEWVRTKGVDDGFEGNPQSFRILTRLAYASESGAGLNLTRATLNGVLKYPWLWSQVGQKKWGAYDSEREEFEWAREALTIAPRERTLEAEIMDWADDITYAIHDVEDFYRAGLIPLPSLALDVPEQQELVSRVVASWEEVPGRAPLDSGIAESVGLGPIRLFPLASGFTGTRSERGRLRNWSGTLIGNYVTATALSRDGLSIQFEAELQVTLLKELTRLYVLEGQRLAIQQVGEKRIIRELLDTYWSSLGEGNIAVLPPRLQQEAQEILDSGGGHNDRVRLVADAVSSMTEEEAMRMHQRLTGTSLGSLMDWTMA